jgi:hypothetical protein
VRGEDAGLLDEDLHFKRFQARIEVLGFLGLRLEGGDLTFVVLSLVTSFHPIAKRSA